MSMRRQAAPADADSMLILDHESLEPFEPEIGNLFDSAFGDALRGLAAVGLRPGDEWHTEAALMFQAACLPGFRRAQDAVGIRVLDLERQIASLERKEARAKAKRDASTANESKVLRNVLQNRQLVLRRLIDAMLWTLIWPHKWLLRRLRLDGGIKRVDPNVVEPVLKCLADEKSERDESVSLICDLTTVAQLGDLIMAFWNPSRNAMKIVIGELKVGPMNQLLHERLNDPEVTDIDIAVSKISQDLGPKAQKQAVRMARQQKRLKDFDRVIASDEGVDPVSGRKFRMTKDAHVFKDYRDQIRALIGRAKLDGSSALTLDGCLHLLAAPANNRGASDRGLRVAHEFYHMRHGVPCKIGSTDTVENEELEAIINGPKPVNLFDFGLRNSLALPPLLWYPRESMLDVLMGRIRIFAQLDHLKFFELAAGSGLNMRFIRGKEAGRTRSAKMSGSLIEYRDLRYVKASNARGHEMMFGARFFARVYLDLVRPNSLLAMAEELMETAEKDKQAVARSVA